MAQAIGSSSPVPSRLYQADQRRIWKAIEQLQRPRVRQAPATSGGGPVGIVDVQSVNGSVYPRTSGIGIQANGVTYRDPTTRHGSSSWLSVTGSDLVVTRAGWYEAVLQVAIGWNEADAPTAIDVYINGGADIAHQGAEYLPTVAREAGRKGVYRFVSRGPTYMDSGDMFSAEITWGPEAPTAAFVSFAGGSARLNWTITKLA